MKSTIAIVSAVAFGFTASAHEPSRGQEVLRITIYDGASVRPATLSDAVTQLRWVFRQAGVALDIAVGHPNDQAASFTYVPTPDMNHVKEAACHALREIRVEIVRSSPAGLSNGVLGMSSPFARAGVNVRLFSDHIEQGAYRHGRPYSSVLSYAMAHEIGHVLLRSVSHPAAGIMSSVWTAREYSQMDRGPLLFTSDEVKEIISNLGGIGCPIN